MDPSSRDHLGLKILVSVAKFPDFEYAAFVDKMEKFLLNEANSNMPGEGALLNIIANFKGKKAFEIVTEDHEGRKFGNHGDALMYEVFQELLSEANITLVDAAEEADFFLVRPNGALLESYQFPDILAKKLSSLPDIPLIIFPSSALFPTLDPAYMFEGRMAPTLWIFREKYSYDHIRFKWSDSLREGNVQLFLDHDVVASGHRFVSGIVGGPFQSRCIVLAGRIDSEARKSFDASAASTPRKGGKLILKIKKTILSLISNNPDSPVSRILAKFIYEKRLIAAADDLFSTLPQNIRTEIGNLDLPVRKIDLSNQLFVSFDGYTKTLREAAIVVTDRLHVALPAAIVGKRVFLVEAGYHKLTGVYQQSLTRMTNVTLINAYSEK